METANQISNPAFAIFWSLLVLIAISMYIFLFWFSKRLQRLEKCKKIQHYKYIFLHPRGIVEKKEFPITPTEEGIYMEAWKAKQFSERHPYFKVACVPIEQTDYSQVEWKSAFDYFGVKSNL